MSASYPRILFVDNDVDTRHHVAETLRSAGFEVDEASDEDAALVALDPEHDVVVLGVRSPDASAWQLCRTIKQNPGTSNVMVLALSNTQTSAQERAQGLDRGADTYLAPPVEDVELIATIRSLIRVRRIIDERAHQQERFIASIGHDLRTPLSTLSLAVELLRKSSNLDEREHNLLAKVGRGISRIKSLCDKLLRLNQILAGGDGTAQRADVDLVSLVQQVVTGRKDSTDQIQLDMPDSPVRASGDAAALALLVDNLIANALRRETGPVIVRAFGEPGVACVAVRNDAASVVTAADKVLFHPLEDSGDESGRFGLGLLIVDRIAQAHGGSVSISSEPDQGTSFIVRIPSAA